VLNVKEFEKKISKRDYGFSEIRSISEDIRGLTKKQDDSVSYQFIISGRKIPFIIGMIGLFFSFLMMIMIPLSIYNCYAYITKEALGGDIPFAEDLAKNIKMNS
jgi:hypothetical protein